jgi:hypothetical protein
LICSTIILPAAILLYLLLTAADSDKAQAYALTTKFQSRTSDDILAKVLIDEAIQALQNGNRTTAIKYLIVADQGLNSGLENPSSVEPSLIVEYLVQLMRSGTNSVTNNKALIYLNLVDSQLGYMLNESNTNTTIPGDVFLTYRNQKYGIKMQYPYYWSIDGNSYPAGKIGIQVVSFFLPSGGSDLPIVSIGIDNLSKSFRDLPVHLDEYLRLSLKYKNSTGFPGFKLIQSNVNHNTSKNGTRSLFGGNSVYTIIPPNPYVRNEEISRVWNNSRRK